jgi:hypothetical protein
MYRRKLAFPLPVMLVLCFIAVSLAGCGTPSITGTYNGTGLSAFFAYKATGTGTQYDSTTIETMSDVSVSLTVTSQNGNTFTGQFTSADINHAVTQEDPVNGTVADDGTVTFYISDSSLDARIGDEFHGVYANNQIIGVWEGPRGEQGSFSISK